MFIMQRTGAVAFHLGRDVEEGVGGGCSYTRGAGNAARVQ